MCGGGSISHVALSSFLAVTRSRGTKKGVCSGCWCGDLFSSLLQWGGGRGTGDGVPVKGLAGWSVYSRQKMNIKKFGKPGGGCVILCDPVLKGESCVCSCYVFFDKDAPVLFLSLPSKKNTRASHTHTLTHGTCVPKKMQGKKVRCDDWGGGMSAQRCLCCGPGMLFPLTHLSVEHSAEGGVEWGVVMMTVGLSV